MERPSSKPEASESRRVVLVVEDNRDIRAMLSRVLSANGWKVVTAGDGLSALQIIDAQRFDAVVSDLHVSGPDGSMVLQYARQRCPNCILCLISGWVTRRARERAREIGAAIFEKPVDFDALLEELNRGPAQT